MEITPFNLSLPAETIDSLLLWLDDKQDVIIKQTDLLSGTGQSTTATMTQKAITDAIGAEATARANADDALTTAIGTKADASSVYTKVQADVLLNLKADKSTTYTKTETDNLLGGKQDTLTFDAAPTNSSTNPVTSGGVYTAIETLEMTKQDVLTFDNTPLTGSTNPVTSDGIEQALSSISTTLGDDIQRKQDKDTDAVEGNLAVFDQYGNSVDAGIAPSDKQDKDTDAVSGNVAVFDGNGQTRDSGVHLANGIVAPLSRINRDFGRYANPESIVLAVATNGKYIDKDSAQEVSNASYAISSPLSLAAGDILLVPSASAVAAACSVVSKKVTNTYNKVIIYTYTYDDYGRIASATADYSSSLVYTAHYASELETTPDYWTYGGEQYASLPSTHSVTESFYEPLVKQSVAAMPSEGYYVYLASSAMDVVVSAFTATINGGIAIKVGWGIFKNIATNFVGIDKQRVIAEAIADLKAQVEAIQDKLLNGLSKLKVGHLVVDRELSGLNVDGSFCLRAAGAPSASLVPDNWDSEKYGDWKGIPQFIGQEYADTTSRIIYKAIGVAAVSDWLRISNA